MFKPEHPTYILQPTLKTDKISKDIQCTIMSHCDSAMCVLDFMAITIREIEEPRPRREMSWALDVGICMHP